MNLETIQALEDAHLARVYARRPIAIVSGKGVHVYDSSGKDYIDCAGGYGTCLVGHTHPRVTAAISEQARTLTSCHGSTYNNARASLLDRLTRIMPSRLERVFLSNSGAEAVECAFKVARKATGRRKIIAMKGGFHGKTHGALSATWDNKYRKSFEPLVPDFTHVPYGDEEAAKAAISSDTAAVIVEPIQGEAGIRVPPPDWLHLLMNLAHDEGSLVIADEVQTGFGRTGKVLACEHFEVTPDILCLGKGVASGLPIGLTLAEDEIMGKLSGGEHTSTFGGNPVVCAAATATIDVLFDEHLVENAGVVGGYLKSELLNLKKRFRITREVRGMGLMVGVEMRFDVLPILQHTLEGGVLLLDAGRNVLRFLPPLCLTRADVDNVVSVLDKSLESEEIARLPGQPAQ